MVDPNKIHILEISPCGRLLAGFIGDKDIFIKIINQPTIAGYISLDDIKKLMEFRKLDSFMPIYFDLDYRHKATKVARTGAPVPGD